MLVPILLGLSLINFHNPCLNLIGCCYLVNNFGIPSILDKP